MALPEFHPADPDHPFGLVPIRMPGPYRTPCTACGGHGVTGEQREIPGPAVILLADVICPACGGCGNGDPAHRGCPATLHPGPNDGSTDSNGETGPLCPSCQGRQRNLVQSSPSPSETQPGQRPALLRVPCGCTETRVIHFSPLRACPGGCGSQVRDAGGQYLMFSADGKSLHPCRPLAS